MPEIFSSTGNRSRRSISALPTIAALLLMRVGDVRAAPFRVCTFAFNSPDELAAIKSELSPRDFEFVDLSPAHVFGEGGALLPMSSSASAPAPGWLMNRCRPDLHCDIVVYSGEFAGGFFGNYGVSLNVQEIEEASCQPRCQGLFHEPREVFLLACNTLATKNADDRTPQEYLQVLLSHGFSQAAAERVVAAAADHEIVAVAAVRGIRPRPEVEEVVAGHARDRVVAQSGTRQ